MLGEKLARELGEDGLMPQGDSGTPRRIQGTRYSNQEVEETMNDFGRWQMPQRRGICGKLEKLQQL